MSEITEELLYQFADEFALKWWGVKYDGLIDLKNRRWKRLNGQFLAPHNAEGIEELPPIIRMCKCQNAVRTIEEVKGTLLHELVHWRLFVCGKPHHDRNREFVQEAVRVGAPISQTREAQRAFENFMRGEERQ